MLTLPHRPRFCSLMILLKLSREADKSSSSSFIRRFAASATRRLAERSATSRRLTIHTEHDQRALHRGGYLSGTG